MLSEINVLKDELFSLREIQEQIINNIKDESVNKSDIKQSVLLNCNAEENHNSKIDLENLKTLKNKSLYKVDKSNTYLPTNETYRRNELTHDFIQFAREDNGNIKIANYSMSNITYVKSDLNKCFIEENQPDRNDANANDSSLNPKKQDNIINITEIETSFIKNEESLIQSQQPNNYDRFINNSLSNLNRLNAEREYHSEPKVNNSFSDPIHQRNSNNFTNQSVSGNAVNNIGLPNIENFFIQKDKIFLVDNNKKVWHLKKCKRFDKIEQQYISHIDKFPDQLDNETNALNRDNIFSQFLNFYQTKENKDDIQDKSLDNAPIDSEMRNKPESASQMPFEASEYNNLTSDQAMKNRGNHLNKDFNSIDSVSELSRKSIKQGNQADFEENTKNQEESIINHTQNNNNDIKKNLAGDFLLNKSEKYSKQDMNTNSNKETVYLSIAKDIDKDTTYNLSDDSM